MSLLLRTTILKNESCYQQRYELIHIGDTSMELEKTLQMNTLFAFYGPLLTNKQREYMQLYYADDYSLGEIAEDFNVSRQAVYDNVRRSEEILKDYEAKLHLVTDYEQRQKGLQELQEYITTTYGNDDNLKVLIDKITQEPRREGN
jgi:hypothetical protein